jgi:NAD(P)-dependent dehydrogenase (short-subunit alcohol dehydrogenase family)
VAAIEERGVNATSIRADLADPDGIESMFRTVEQRGGRIVALSPYGSTFGFAPGAKVGSMQAAPNEWARHIAVELAPLGINVDVLMLGVIEPDSSGVPSHLGLEYPPPDTIRRIPKGRPGLEREVVGCAMFLLSPASEYVTGTTIVVDDGLTAALPGIHSDTALG